MAGQLLQVDPYTQERRLICDGGHLWVYADEAFQEPACSLCRPYRPPERR